ncbi:uncharacterized protein LOC128951708 isoform X2 [Oppia nitens]|uniref:uncharacterized protein LOC128951708 isoform X2 n=1 Tax=Oppia nitens TaxID=1686743 RepID=UPI0023DC9927|nr:uncharacterized protein LOC128951708 isoform X2 [Oppia nitens]
MRLQLSKSSYGNVFLSQTDLHTDGTYRCEVSAEAPSFQTVRKEKELKVYSLPKEGPTITGIKAQQYGIGDLVNVTCRAGPSKPQPTLSWLINSEPADETYLRYIHIPKRRDGLQESALQLLFNAERHQFIGGIIKLRCTSVISQAYSMSSEEIIVSDHAKASHTHSVHESDGPIISGGRPTYNVDDVINLTCTSVKSYPAPQLQFFINDKEARPEFLRVYPKVQFQDGDEVSQLGLIMRVNPIHLGGSATTKRRTHSSGKDNQQIKLKCTATMEKVIDSSSRETIIGSSQQRLGLTVDNHSVHLNQGQTSCSVLSTQMLVLLTCCYTIVWYLPLL